MLPKEKELLAVEVGRPLALGSCLHGAHAEEVIKARGLFCVF